MTINARDTLNSYLKNRLIDNSTNDCTLIAGQWGCGKSYFIRDFFKKIQNDPQCNRTIILLSIFKMCSIQDLQDEISLKYFAWTKTVDKAIDCFDKLKDIIPYGKAIPIRTLFSLVKKNGFKNCIIAFDDFERLSPKIDLNSILGFISELKEVNKCKIAIIANEEELTSRQKSPFDTDDKIETTKRTTNNDIPFNNNKLWTAFKEKIVDYHIEFSPTPEDNFNLLMTQDIYKQIRNSGAKQIISKCFTSNNIVNMRTMQRAANNITQLPIVLENAKLEISKETIKSIAYETIKLCNKDDKKKITTNDIYYAELSPDVRELISEFINKGHLDIEKFNSTFKEYIMADYISSSVGITINKFYRNIKQDPETTISELENIIKKHCTDIPYGTVIRILQLFSRLDEKLLHKYSYILEEKIEKKALSYFEKYGPFTEVPLDFYELSNIKALQNIATESIKKFNAKTTTNTIQDDDSIKKFLSANNQTNHPNNITEHIPRERWEYLIANDIIDLYDIAKILHFRYDNATRFLVDILNSHPNKQHLKVKLLACGLDEHLLEQFSEDTTNGKAR